MTRIDEDVDEDEIYHSDGGRIVGDERRIVRKKSRGRGGQASRRQWRAGGASFNVAGRRILRGDGHGAVKDGYSFIVKDYGDGHQLARACRRSTPRNRRRPPPKPIGGWPIRPTPATSRCSSENPSARKNSMRRRPNERWPKQRPGEP